jgi:uncharacterized protein YcfL
MKMRIFLPLAAAGFAAGLLTVSGCKTSVNSVENAQKTGQRQMVTDQRVVTDRGLAKKVSIVGVNQVTTSGGFLKVQIELLNTTRSPQRFSYRFEWFDASGMLLNSAAMPTFADQIDGGEDKFITGQAPTPASKDFRVKFIENTN